MLEKHKCTVYIWNSDWPDDFFTNRELVTFLAIHIKLTATEHSYQKAPQCQQPGHCLQIRKSYEKDGNQKRSKGSKRLKKITEDNYASYRLSNAFWNSLVKRQHCDFSMKQWFLGSCTTSSNHSGPFPLLSYQQAISLHRNVTQLVFFVCLSFFFFAPSE